MVYVLAFLAGLAALAFVWWFLRSRSSPGDVTVAPSPSAVSARDRLTGEVVPDVDLAGETVFRVTPGGAPPGWTGWEGVTVPDDPALIVAPPVTPDDSIPHGGTVPVVAQPGTVPATVDVPAAEDTWLAEVPAPATRRPGRGARAARRAARRGGVA